MGDINVSSIKAEEDYIKILEEPTETNRNEQEPLEPAIVEAEICDNRSTIQHHAIDTSSIVTAQ